MSLGIWIPVLDRMIPSMMEPPIVRLCGGREHDGGNPPKTVFKPRFDDGTHEKLLKP
jgi:hypothetical protein